ncbi:MAG: hypothetical protein EXS35_01780 [Pedosphaera sp.]|nr:hypothetical protein [Pedosphaera sp.]
MLSLRSISKRSAGFLCAITLPFTAFSAEKLNRSAGPLFSHFALTLEVGQRTEAVGPLFYRQLREDDQTVAFPPLFSHVTDVAIDSEEYDFAYPLLTYDRFGSEYRWQLFQLFSFAGGKNQADTNARRFTLFPIYFQQRSPDPALNYTALLPFYGHIKNRLFRDEIFFVMFPAYSQTRKRDVVTDNYLYPIFHRRRGENLSGWQFWPLVGAEHKGITTKTNGWGDAELIAGHESVFALWPIYLNATTGIGTENPQKEFAVLPLYTSLRSTNRDSTTVIWPFFTRTDDRVKKYREWDVPWPLLVFARGEGKTTTRVFPLFSQSHNAALESDYYLWPLYKYNRLHADSLDRDRTRILWFLYSTVNEKNLETGAARQRTDFWPFFTRRRDFNGNSRWQILAPLEPFLPNHKSIERNYSPVWSVWRSEKNPKTGHASQSLLWNLYRRETTPDARKCSLLFGLFQYQSTPDTKHWRLFYIPVSKPQKNSDHVPEHR